MVLRMLWFSEIESVFRPGIKPISEIVLFGSYFILALGFSFILLFLRLTFLKVINFQMWLTIESQEQHNERPFEKEVKYLSRG